MLNEIISLLAAAVIGALPAAPAADIVVRYDDIEKAVVTYLNSNNETKTSEYTVDCHKTGTITLTEISSLHLDCDIHNLTLKTVHPSNVSAFLEGTTLQVAVVVSEGYVDDPSKVAEEINTEDSNG